MHFNKKNNRYVITAATIFVLAIMSSSIMVTAPAAATTATTTTSVGRGEQEAVGSTTTPNNDASNALLGNLVMIVEFETANINPINETYIEISTVSNVTIIPPNATGGGTTINATETANATLNILPNGLGLSKGQSLLVTQGDNDGDAEQENATTTFVGITRITPDGPEGGTDVVFFSTNSTRQLAFLDNMVGIMQSEFSPGGGIIRTWEWKGGGTLPFETGGGGATTMENQTTITPVL